MKHLRALLSLALILAIFCSLNFELTYSQTLEDPKSLNCKDNADQSQYVSNVKLQNNSNGPGPVTTDLPGFHYVKKFTSTGTLITAWGTKGTGPGQFLHAHGIAVDSKGNVYVSDAEKCNIQKFDNNGKFITMWGTRGTGPGQFLQPESIAVDSKDNIFVADYADQRIQKFDSYGKFITMWGSKGKGDGQFIKPWGVAVDSNDNVYTSDQAVDSSLIGPMKGKTISDLVASINAGNNYVNVHTQAHPDGEIRGQLEISGQKNATSDIQNNTDAQTKSVIVTPTSE